MNSDMDMAVVEIQGTKLHIGASGFKKVEHYKVGDSVKVLIKEYSEYRALPGVILGFDNFPSLPTMSIAYLKAEYTTSELKIIHFNQETKDVQIAPMNDYDLAFDKETVVEQLESEIVKKTEELRSATHKKELFLRSFGKFFKETF